MVAYKCDKCGKHFDWYECFYHDKKFNDMSYREIEKWKEENPNAEYWDSPRANWCANALQIMFYEPVNENCVTNKGKLQGRIQPCEDGNNPLIMLCPDCMTDFFSTLQEFWNQH